MADSLLLLNLVASWVMVGVIWFVQVVHYPLLSVVPVESAVSVAHEHQRRTALVVMAPMTVQGFTALGLLYWTPLHTHWQQYWVSGFFIGVALLCTVLLSVPRHQRMVTNPDVKVGRELVNTNWPRTIAWTLSAVIISVSLIQRLN